MSTTTDPSTSSGQAAAGAAYKIAVVGAGGKMGMRVSNNLVKTDHTVWYVENSPAGPLTAKNGWGTTPMNALIHGWTSHFARTGTSVLSNTFSRRMSFVGIMSLNAEFDSTTARTL